MQEIRVPRGEGISTARKEKAYSIPSWSQRHYLTWIRELRPVLYRAEPPQNSGASFLCASALDTLLLIIQHLRPLTHLDVLSALCVPAYELCSRYLVWFAGLSQWSEIARANQKYIWTFARFSMTNHELASRVAVRLTNYNHVLRQRSDEATWQLITSGLERRTVV